MLSVGLTALIKKQGRHLENEAELSASGVLRKTDLLKEGQFLIPLSQFRTPPRSFLLLK